MTRPGSYGRSGIGIPIPQISYIKWDNHTAQRNSLFINGKMGRI
jgi:hypothetical protein